ncbi:MAG: hypothetical protein V7771_18185 [Shewanella psychromarinicola]|uniref:hypothetical protein n=1 Tax=Shewanella psychromarinicola TaxID=2487742 RepID=UPI0030026F7E
MSFDYKDTKAALHAYTSALNALKIGQSFFAKLNLEYSRLLIKLLNLLFKANSLSRLDEFLNDFKLFSIEMLRKYEAQTPNDYSLDKPFERKIGIKSRQEESDALSRIESRYSNEYDVDDLSF